MKNQHPQLQAVLSELAKLRAGNCPVVSVDDGDGVRQPVSSDEEAAEIITSVDEAFVFVQVPGRREPLWTWWILGNGDEEIIADYVANPTLDSILSE